MGSPTGFIDFGRSDPDTLSPLERLRHFNEFVLPTTKGQLEVQGARCMDCGVPFCQSEVGCPVANLIPEWNHLIYSGHWREALIQLHQTNNFPEFTGRVCPAPCEGACVLGINEAPVAIKDIEKALIDYGFEQGWVSAYPPPVESGKSVAVIGSGPSGLAAAQQLRRAGHGVTVYERDDRLGGLLMYGIPNMKLDKALVNRRLEQMQSEGVRFVTGVNVGVDVHPEALRQQHHALLLAIGATQANDLTLPGRELSGVHQAMDFLRLNTKSLLDSAHTDGCYISVKDQDVIVIGGGDTGTDCVATALRHGCRSLVNFELMPRPPSTRAADNPWPQWPLILRTDYGHSEAIARDGEDPRQYSILAQCFLGDEAGKVTGARAIKVNWTKGTNGRRRMSPLPGSEQEWRAQHIFLALGFVGPEPMLIEQLGLDTDPRSYIKAGFGFHQTNLKGVFAAGDCRRGQSLVVWGIREGREAATAIDRFLSNQSPASRLAHKQKNLSESLE